MLKGHKFFFDDFLKEFPIISLIGEQLFYTENKYCISTHCMIRDGTTCTVPANRNSSKNRVKLEALPSRSGVLIEFQSQVFTSNSRAISGLKLEFSQS